MASPVDTFVQQHDDFEYVREGAKVRCTLTGQDFPLRLEILEQYTKSKGYIKAKTKGRNLDLKFDYSKYEPHITQHKKMQNALFCNLTGACLNKIPEEVEKHIAGRRYLI